MYVRVRTMDASRCVTIPTSRTTLVGHLKQLVEERFGVEPDKQRLIFRGKQLENEYSLYDYSININDVIQLIVITPESISATKQTSNTENYTAVVSCSSASNDTSNDIPGNSDYFKIGDYVDVRDYQHGSWFLGKLIKIKKNKNSVDVPNEPNSPIENDGLVYVVSIEGCPDQDPIEVQLQGIRPHAFEIVPLNKLKINDKVLMNYNTDHPHERGYWFDVLVKEIKITRKIHKVIGDIFIGINNTVIQNCQLNFLDDIYNVKPHQLLSERTPEEDKIMQTKPLMMRASPLNCIDCRDKSSKLCKTCGCSICGGKDREDLQILCDECNLPFHISCLTPPLEEIPNVDYWYCPSCKNDENEIVKAGDKLKVSKKMKPSSMSKSKRDWGKGMACVGRTKTCNTVPSNHFGSIPGIEVGSSWLFRVQVSEAGVHRPPVGGIHGRDNEGAFSIVLSGGYEDDIDDGDEFLYTGSGGRDLSGNKRTAVQSCDQTLTRFNKALALNCNEKIDSKNGVVAVNWKKGKPVRVVRNSNLRKHSKYAPELGNRYDGLYKVVKYYPETGKSGFIVWRFVLRRDDPAPAPWTEKGRKRIAQLGLTLVYPENYIPPDKKSTSEINSEETKSKRKRTLQNTDMTNNKQCGSNNDSPEENDDKISTKKIKITYELDKTEKQLINADAINKKNWEDCKESLINGKKAFLDKVEEKFLCICCQEIVFEPITLECCHNFCKACLKRSFMAEVYHCPSCRAELGQSYCMNINMKLTKALLCLFPGYNVGR